MLSLAATLLLSTAALTAALAAPSAERIYPEVKPGPGLPSLSSLGITSKELYEKKIPSPPTHPFFPGNLPTHRDFDAFCGGGTSDTAAVDDVIACFNYLVNIGNNDCVIAGDGAQHNMCEAGTARINGVDEVVGDSTTSSCYDVALAVQWVFTYCDSNGKVEGDQAAYGNGNLVVVVGGPL